MSQARYDFDKIVDRNSTDCVKIDLLENLYGRKDLLPLWVADMDFETPPFILEALRERLAHPVLGYGVTPKDFIPSIVDWVYDHHGWKIEKDWVCFIPGIVRGIGMVVNSLLSQDDKVIIQPPVYHPFRLVPLGLGRQVLYNPLIEGDGTYSMDLEGLEEICRREDARLLVLSNPHNPAGITWDRDTLSKVAEICSRNDVLVISDEIHCDMALFGNKHIPFASVGEKAASCSITFAAPSKTFNIAGIVSSYAVVPNETIRRKFFSWLEAGEMSDPNILSPIATIAAFRKGEGWRRQMVSYLEKNVLFVEDYCRRYLPGIRPWRPCASFLVWLDCRGLGLDHDSLVELFVEKAHLALNDGRMFGKEGNLFMRLNIGCPTSILEEALGRLRVALSC